MRRLPLLHSQGQAQLEASGKGRGTPLETQARHLVEQAEADVLRRGGQHLLQHMVLEERPPLRTRRRAIRKFLSQAPSFHDIIYRVYCNTRSCISQ